MKKGLFILSLIALAIGICGWIRFPAIFGDARSIWALFLILGLIGIIFAFKKSKAKKK